MIYKKDAGSMAVLNDVESFRVGVESALNRNVLEEVPPLPDVPMKFEAGIIDSCNRETLLGPFLWAGRHL